MRKNFLWLVLAAGIMASCGESKKDKNAELNDKKAQLEKLKSEQKSTNDKISKLEADIKSLDPTASAATAKLVSIDTVGVGSFSHYIELQGRVDAQNISYVAPPNGQGGVVTALYVKQGQNVKKGQLLAKLDDQLIRQQIDPIRVQLNTAEDTYKRTKNLFDQGVGTYQNVLNAKTQVESLEKQIAIIQRQVALTNVTAPVSGVADQVNVRVGEMFAAGSPIPQIRIVNTGDLKIVAAVPENYLGRVKQGATLQVVLPEENNRIITAKVNVIQTVIDPNTRSFNIEAQIPSQASLKPNQIAQVRILDYTANNTVVIPVNTVQSDENGKYVFVMEKNGNNMVARKKSVNIGESYGDNIEVKSGLSNGDRIITEGYQDLYDGQVITTL